MASSTFQCGFNQENWHIWKDVYTADTWNCADNQVAFKLACLGSQLTLKFLKSITSIDSVFPRRALCAGLFKHKERRVKGKCSVLSSKIASPAANKRMKNWVQAPVFLR